MITKTVDGRADLCHLVLQCTLQTLTEVARPGERATVAFDETALDCAGVLGWLENAAGDHVLTVALDVPYALYDRDEEHRLWRQIRKRIFDSAASGRFN